MVRFLQESFVHSFALIKDLKEVASAYWFNSQMTMLPWLTWVARKSLGPCKLFPLEGETDYLSQVFVLQACLLTAPSFVLRNQMRWFICAQLQTPFSRTQPKSSLSKLFVRLMLSVLVQVVSGASLKPCLSVSVVSLLLLSLMYRPAKTALSHKQTSTKTIPSHVPLPYSSDSWVLCMWLSFGQWNVPMFALKAIVVS